MLTEQKDCEWWVDDDDQDIGNYTHEYAINHNCGFCLIKELFTHCEGRCKDYKRSRNGTV